jgi:hypothetical protein
VSLVRRQMSSFLPNDGAPARGDRRDREVERRDDDGRAAGVAIDTVDRAAGGGGEDVRAVVDVRDRDDVGHVDDVLDGFDDRRLLGDLIEDDDEAVGVAYSVASEGCWPIASGLTTRSRSIV